MCKKPIDADEALRKVDLEDRMDNFPSQMSGGQQQRVSIARAIARRPKILLCDEPTGALDYKTGKQILELLEDTCRNDKITTVIITHNSAIARMKSGEKIDEYLKNGYSTLSLGYVGIYEATKLMKGCNHFSSEGHDFAIKIMKKMKEATEKWRKETGLDFVLYGTPRGRACYRFARIDKEEYGQITDVTDKGYYTDSYHIDNLDNMDVYEKLEFESEFQKLSLGGAISYIKLQKVESIEDMIKYIFENVQYAEFL